MTEITQPFIMPRIEGPDGFEYAIVRSRRKTMSIIIERDRKVVVRAPEAVTDEKIAAAVAKKSGLIRQKIAHNQKYPAIQERKQFLDGESLLFLGRAYALELVVDQEQDIIFDNRFYLRTDRQQGAAEIFHSWYVQQAESIILPKAAAIAKAIGVQFRKLNILDLKYRWGSCTPKDNIHFNWRLIKAPMTVVEYIIAHELTHLLVANHTAEFWNRVAAQQPAYEDAKRWLKDYGTELERDF